MKTAKQVMQYIPKRKSRALKDYVTNEVLSYSRYLFVWREEDGYYGHCTHCKKEYKVEQLKHKSRVDCKRCGSSLRVQYEYYSRTKMVDVEYLLFYEKALKDKTSIVARAFLVTRDYRFSDFRSVKTRYEHDASFLFAPHRGAWMVYNAHHGDYLRDTVISPFANSFGGNYRVNVCKKSVDEAVKGTPFQYFNYDGYGHLWHWGSKIRDWTGYFNLVAKYPCIEYLEKLGLGELFETKLKDQKTYSSINWNGKTIDQVLKVPKQNVKEVIKNASILTPRTLRIYQLLLRDDPSATVEKALQTTDDLPDGGLHEDLMKVMRIGNGKIERVLRYIKFQAKKDRNSVNEHYSIVRKMSTYADYLDDCQALGKNLKRFIVLYPRDLDLAHRETIKQRRYKEDKELDEKIAARAEKLKKLKYKSNGLVARPFTNTGEIIYEGKKLDHCIGQYIEKYAKGTTSILAIRKENEIDEPYYTMEVANGRVKQYYGFDNNIGTEKDPEVIDFVNAYEKEVLNQKENVT